MRARQTRRGWAGIWDVADYDDVIGLIDMMELLARTCAAIEGTPEWNVNGPRSTVEILALLFSAATKTVSLLVCPTRGSRIQLREGISCPPAFLSSRPSPQACDTVRVLKNRAPLSRACLGSFATSRKEPLFVRVNTGADRRRNLSVRGRDIVAVTISPADGAVVRAVHLLSRPIRAPPSKLARDVW
jgi:hypothetical protein